MGALEDLLGPEESIEHEARRHPAAVLRRAAAFVLVSAAALAAGTVITPRSGTDPFDLALGALVGVFLLRLFTAFVRWRSEQILVTDRRLLAATGLIRKKVTSVPLRRVQRATLNRSGWGRILGHGDLVLDLGGEGSLLVERLSRPKHAYRVVTSLVEEEPQPLRDPDDPSEADTGPLPRVVL